MFLNALDWLRYLFWVLQYSSCIPSINNSVLPFIIYQRKVDTFFFITAFCAYDLKIKSQWLLQLHRIKPLPLYAKKLLQLLIKTCKISIYTLDYPYFTMQVRVTSHLPLPVPRKLHVYITAEVTMTLHIAIAFECDSKTATLVEKDILLHLLLTWKTCPCHNGGYNDIAHSHCLCTWFKNCNSCWERHTSAFSINLKTCPCHNGGYNDIARSHCLWMWFKNCNSCWERHTSASPINLKNLSMSQRRLQWHCT